MGRKRKPRPPKPLKLHDDFLTFSCEWEFRQEVEDWADLENNGNLSEWIYETIKKSMTHKRYARKKKGQEYARSYFPEKQQGQ